jgi:hypothetical protein
MVSGTAAREGIDQGRLSRAADGCYRPPTYAPTFESAFKGAAHNRVDARVAFGDARPVSQPLSGGLVLRTAQPGDLDR